MSSRGALIKFNFLSLDPIGFGDDARVMESSAFQQLCRMFHEMNILCFNQSWFSTLDPNPIVLFCSLCVTLYCHFTTPEILLADLFFFNLLHFYYLITLYNILFFSSFAILYSFTIYYLFFRNQIELFRASHRACSFPHPGEKTFVVCHFVFVSLHDSTNHHYYRVKRRTIISSASLSRDLLLISFQCGKAKVVSDGGDQGFERLRSRFWDILFSSLREKGIHIDR